MPLPAPKAPSSLIKVSRWTMLGFGIYYGYNRREELKKIEDVRRAREESERPARECAMAAELAKKSKEEMDYLAQQAGVGKYAKKKQCLYPSSIGVGFRRKEYPPPSGPYTLPPRVPKCECTDPSGESVVPSGESIVPSGESTVPSCEPKPTVPTGGSSISSEGSAVPTKATAPSDGSASISSGESIPRGKSTVPSDESTVPSGESPVPTGGSSISSEGSAVPTEATAPSDGSAFPSSSESPVPSSGGSASPPSDQLTPQCIPTP